MRYLEYWGCPGTSWEDLQVKHPEWHIGRLPNGICEVIGTTILWWAQSPGSCASSFSQPLSHVNHLSILCRARKKWAFWAASYMASLGKPGTQYTLTVTVKKNHRSKGSLLVQSCDGRRDVDKTKLFLHSSMHLCSDIFVQLCAETSPLDSWTPTKLLLSMDNCQNQRSLEGYDGLNSSSAILWLTVVFTTASVKPENCLLMSLETGIDFCL